MYAVFLLLLTLLPSYSISKIYTWNKDQIWQFNQISAFIAFTVNLMQWKEMNYRESFTQVDLSLQVFCYCMAWILENKLMDLCFDIIFIIVQPVNSHTLTAYKIIIFHLSKKPHLREFQSLRTSPSTVFILWQTNFKTK